MTDQSTDQSTISHADAMRIRNACFRMPYAATPRVKMPDYPITADKIVIFLESLAAALKDVGLHETNMEAELSQHRNDVAAFRRIMGTGDGS